MFLTMEQARPAHITRRPLPTPVPGTWSFPLSSIMEARPAHILHHILPTSVPLAHGNTPCRHCLPFAV